jgi:hypothetical protein
MKLHSNKSWHSKLSPHIKHLILYAKCKELKTLKQFPAEWNRGQALLSVCTVARARHYNSQSVTNGYISYSSWTKKLTQYFTVELQSYVYESFEMNSLGLWISHDWNTKIYMCWSKIYKSIVTPLQMSGSGYFSHTRCWQLHKLDHTAMQSPQTHIGIRMSLLKSSVTFNVAPS